MILRFILEFVLVNISCAFRVLFAIGFGLLFGFEIAAGEVFPNQKQTGRVGTELGVDDRFADMRKRVLDLADLKSPPKIFQSTNSTSDDGVRSLYFEGLSWQGKPTRVFALLGLPEKITRDAGNAPVPGVVLVHGGGGTAFRPWVKKWNERGFAAISIAVEGQTDQRDQKSKKWVRHQWAGPERKGIYGDSDLPLEDQWMYHGVADTILANSLLRSMPEVDSNRIGLVGISWGGVITSTVIGIDRRFAFAVPTYGCGDLADAENQYGRVLGQNQVYRKVWDPMVRLDRVSIPVLWLTWPGDLHFPLDSVKRCYEKTSGNYMVSMIPGMKHSHGAGWNPPDSYTFADSIVSLGKPWCQQQGVVVKGDRVEVRFATVKPISRASLICTSDNGFTGTRKWRELPVKFMQSKDSVIAIATLPRGTTAWFINLSSEGLVASSDYQISK